MEKKINLLIRREGEKRKSKKFFFYSLGTFISTFFLALVVLAIGLLIKQGFSKIEADQNRVRENINRDAEKKIKILTLKNRLENIARIVDSRENFNAVVESILSIFPSDIEIGGIQAGTDEIVIRVQSQDLLVLNTLLEENIKAYTKKENKIKKIDIVSFGFDRDRSLYVLTLAASFGD